MAIEVTMPQMGESVVEGTIAKWLVKEGDVVSEDQPLVEISTDKVDTEIPSPGAGRIAKIIAAEGQTLPVGAKLAEIEPAAGAKAAPAARAESAPKVEAPTKPPLSVVPRSQPAPARPVESAPPPSTAEVSASPARPEAPRPAAAKPSGDHRRYSPVVLKIAAEHSIDLEHVPGTGFGGRVSKRDVERYLDSLRKGAAPAAPASGGGAQAAVAERPATIAAQPATRPAAAVGGAYNPPVYQPREGDEVEAFTRRRKLIAEHMVYSKTHSPHVGTVAEVDVTRAMRFRQTHKDEFQRREGFALTMLPIAAFATVRALKEFPRMNASVVGDSMVIRKQINLGIAMDTEEGLLVPVIKAAEAMSLTGIAREIENLRRKVADKKITADDLAGGSFTLSNPGREGNLYGFAIINQPQVGILRMGEVKKRPVVVEVDGDDAIVIRTMMYLALSYDHRVVDGVLGNRFLYRSARILEEADFEL
jgi:2-oxoglutarate dehydrogenase E2 component (dihydrolipoamide succinyltransferase)